MRRRAAIPIGSKLKGKSSFPMLSVLAWEFSGMAKRSSNGGSAVSVLVAEMRDAIIELAGNRAVFDTRDLWLERAARAAGISKRMAKTFFYNEPCNPSAEVVECVRDARRNLRAKAKENDRTIDATALEERLRRIENALRLQDSDAYRALVDEGRSSQN